MKDKGFVLILIVLALVVIGIGSAILFSNRNKPTGENTAQACPKDLSGVFTKFIIDPDKILALRPLGYTSGTEHILPIDHNGFTLKADSPDEKIPVYAPSDLTITNISSHTDYDSSGKPFTKASNLMFDFKICEGARGWVEFIHELSPPLKSIFDQGNKQHDEGPLNQGARAVNESLQLSYKVKAGELIGYTSSEPALAISVYDDRVTRSDVDFTYYADPERREPAICFTDLYSGEAKKTLVEKYGYYENRQGQTPGFTSRTVEPRCGQVIQNKVGTIQGDWFANKPTHSHESLEAQGKTISFIHFYLDPTIAVISIGGNIVPNPETLMFKPTHSGMYNREFSETKTNEIYCYQPDSQFNDFIYSKKKADGRILVKLVDDHHVKIEAQLGSCGENNVFSNAFTYER